MTGAEMTLSRLAQLVAQLNKSTKQQHKIDILRAHADLRDLLFTIYSDRAFGVTSKAIGPCLYDNQPINRISSLAELVRKLGDGELKHSNNSVSLLSRFAHENKEHVELIKSIVDKNLKARIGPSLLRRAFGTADLQLPIALGYQLDSIEDTIKHINNSDSLWLASRKIDGVRCIVRVDVDRQVTLLSRHGRPFRSHFVNTAFKQHFDAFLRLPFEFGGQPIYIDGELAVIDNNNTDRFQESFTDTVKAVMSEHISDSLACRLNYFMFDCLTESELHSTGNGDTLSRRLERLLPSMDRLHRLSQFHITTTNSPADTINTLCTNAQRFGWEGIILRRDASFKAGRSRDILKVKLFREEEFRVVGIEQGRMRLMIDGVERETNVCKALLIQLEDTTGTSTVSVGSGLSTEERLEFIRNPESVINKFITVKYFERTRNECGKVSLRFPVFKCIRTV